MASAVLLIPYASVMRRKGRYIAWVTSHNGTWMLLSGSWATRKGAAQFCERAGYTLLEPESSLPLIEKQMEARS